MKKVTDYRVKMMSRWKSVSRRRFFTLCLTVVCAVGLLALKTVEVGAQAGRGRARVGLPKKAPRIDRQLQTSDPAQEPQSETGNPQARPSPDDRLIPLGIGPRQRIALVHVFAQLNLSDDQRTKLSQLRRETGNRLALLTRKRQIQNEELEEALYGSEFDPQVVEQKANDLAATTTEMIRLQSKILSQIRQIMTPEQAFKFRELLQEELRRPLLPRNPQ
jgi:Spy/CpxP family protein refolding chaperone